MKQNNYLKSIYGIVMLSLLTFISCTSSTHFSSLRPADIVLPNHIEKIVVIDRSAPSKGFNNVVEGLFTGEGIGQDYAGRKEVIDALLQTLSTSPIYEIIPTGIEMKGSKAGNRIAKPLDAEMIQEITDRYGADALLAIESYDSDNFINMRENRVKKKNKDGTVYYKTSYEAERRFDVQLGYRLYDASDGKILDEYMARSGTTDHASGPTREIARRNLNNKRSVARLISSRAGSIYSQRIAPVYVNESRTYFKKGASAQKDMKRAHKMVQRQDWDRAINYWETALLLATKNKTKGKAAYNLALAYEVNGDLDLAMEWARKAYYDYGLKRAEEYIFILNHKLHQRDRLDDQLTTSHPISKIE